MICSSSQISAVVNPTKQQIEINNFLVWMQQVSATLCGLGLEVFTEEASRPTDSNLAPRFHLTNYSPLTGWDYKVVMVNITSLGLSYTFDEVCSLLLTHERRLEQYGHVINTDGTIPSANMAYHDPVDPNYNPLCDLLKLARRVLLSVPMHGSLIVMLVFFSVKLSLRISPSFFLLTYLLEADLNRVFASENSNVSEDYDGDEQSGSE
ncbi:hypothetical protein QYF36_014045 [Acer negundo]|nr:hypothetical protein QYF36_014045 [Acer negundo]